MMHSQFFFKDEQEEEEEEKEKEVREEQEDHYHWTKIPPRNASTVKISKNSKTKNNKKN